MPLDIIYSAAFLKSKGEYISRMRDLFWVREILNDSFSSYNIYRRNDG
jgi:hypothetical protein